jgi:paraquat-inducible protein A
MERDAMTTQALIACPACDLLHHRTRLAAAATARCSRCGTVLFRPFDQSLDKPLALTVAAIILLALANCFPFISLAISGHTEQALLVSGVIRLVDTGWVTLGLLVLLTGFVFPFLQLAGVAYVLIPLRFGFSAPHLALVYRWVRLLQPWAMTDIFMLGIFVSVAKLAGMGSIIPGAALYAFVALMFTLPAISAALNPESIWERLPLN